MAADFGEDTSMPSTLAEELAVQRLMAEYCRRVDEGRFADAAALFSLDGVFEYAGQSHTGRAVLIAFLEITQVPERRGRHSCGYALVDFDGDRASAVTDFVFYGRADGTWFVKFAGRYHDTLQQISGHWLFAHRRVALD